jgi:hypothetical protein
VLCWIWFIGALQASQNFVAWEMEAPHALQSFVETAAGSALTLLPHRVQKEKPAARSAPQVWQIIVVGLRLELNPRFAFRLGSV